jgi:hypothetical protein
MIFLSILLAGCGSLPEGVLDNRVVCTVAQDKAYVVSLYGPVGLASEIAAPDAEVICTKG